MPLDADIIEQDISIYSLPCEKGQIAELISLDRTILTDTFVVVLYKLVHIRVVIVFNEDYLVAVRLKGQFL